VNPVGLAGVDQSLGRVDFDPASFGYHDIMQDFPGPCGQGRGIFRLRWGSEDWLQGDRNGQAMQKENKPSHAS
jgi:hypothetical protein